ncbi:recombination mediator RecR [Chloracidobacterium aggregatum]|jgi:recombination protein RecR|uniref:Recombination protein RecR n=1 Tax=Chloracidobacterium sp. N TaxID=2821540 RepID=A0ABX8AYF4_9BACT|nr:recombination mediator RecR [Chloracidobacterium aggregatum]QUV84384.1 recombination protein RecR [Chloracidobacterium sp. 2]QUV87132.1 recombination protein RecR [Chloracidobacterium sp. S]QUV93243.1 recombination protein RecR [Chloracidobacterium sp. N]QUV96399.1 recombination protein RecR [Chloracidobacterium sp. E]
MAEFAEPIARLIDEFRRLPGIGHKSAQRLAFHVLRGSAEDAERLALAITEVKSRMTFCSVCHNLTDIGQDPCAYCTNPARDQHLLCVVEEPYNVFAIERTGEYKGLYHVLHGALSPLRGIGPDDIHLRSLLERLRTLEVTEVILATNPTTEGEATANYIGRLLKPIGIRTTRLAMGLPVGGDLEYADEVTLYKALAYRREL